jgi:hypothetical protein
MSFISRINEPAHLSAGKSSAISVPQFLRKKKEHRIFLCLGDRFLEPLIAGAISVLGSNI